MQLAFETFRWVNFRLVLRHIDELAVDRQIGGGQLGHARFDALEIVRGKGPLEGKVVEKAVFDHRADGHLGTRVQLLYGHGQQVRAGVAQQLETFAVAGGDQAELGVVVDQGAGVHQAAIEAASQGGFSQAGADIGGDVGHA